MILMGWLDEELLLKTLCFELGNVFCSQLRVPLPTYLLPLPPATMVPICLAPESSRVVMWGERAVGLGGGSKLNLHLPNMLCVT